MQPPVFPFVSKGPARFHIYDAQGSLKEDGHWYWRVGYAWFCLDCHAYFEFRIGISISHSLVSGFWFLGLCAIYDMCSWLVDRSRADCRSMQHGA